MSVAGSRYDLSEFDDVVVLGGGKASGYMAVELETLLDKPVSRGHIVTDADVTGTAIRVHNGDHPIPSQSNIDATERILDSAEECDENTLVIVLLSGGGSALLTAPVNGIELADVQELTQKTIRSGAPVNVLNTFRKHISKIKGGKLAERLSPATVVGIAISDYIGNDLSVLASGPLSPDPSTFQEAIDLLKEYDIDAPKSIYQRFKQGALGDAPETPTSGKCFQNTDIYIAADSMTAVRSAAQKADEFGYNSLILSTYMRGEAKEVAKSIVSICEEITNSANPVEPPAAIVSGGELTVTVSGGGEGGPNLEFATASRLHGECKEIVVASVDTDGFDGGTDAAGGIVTTKDQSEREDRLAIKNNSTYSRLKSEGTAIFTGHTHTNVNDLRVMIVQ
jgi:hydroxypyruvate reductase